MQHDADELQLTAYALGELESDESAEVEARLGVDAAASRYVEEVRAAGRLVSDSLACPGLAGLSAIQVAAIERRLAGSVAPARSRARGWNWQMWGSLAASVLIVSAVMAEVLPMIYHIGGHPSIAYRSGSGGAGPDAGDHSATLPTAPVDSSPVDPSMSESANDRPDFPGPRFTPLRLDRGESDFVAALTSPLSTLPTTPTWPDALSGGSWATAQRALARRQLPPADAVRTDAIINAVPYLDPPAPAGAGLSGAVEVSACPWNPAHRLVRVGLRAGGSADASGATTRPTSPAVVDLSARVEFNPAVAAAYRLIGYEDGLAQDGLDDASGPRLDDDSPRAGELAPGRMATALYEVAPAGSWTDPNAAIRPALRYQKFALTAPSGSNRELLTLTVRYREAADPRSSAARSLVIPAPDDARPILEASPDLRLAAAAAELGMLLRNSPFKGASNWQFIRDTLADAAAHGDPTGARHRMLLMAESAQKLVGS